MPYDDDDGYMTYAASKVLWYHDRQTGRYYPGMIPLAYGQADSEC